MTGVLAENWSLIGSLPNQKRIDAARVRFSCTCEPALRKGLQASAPSSPRLCFTRACIKHLQRKGILCVPASASSLPRRLCKLSRSSRSSAFCAAALGAVVAHRAIGANVFHALVVHDTHVSHVSVVDCSDGGSGLHLVRRSGSSQYNLHCSCRGLNRAFGAVSRLPTLTVAFFRAAVQSRSILLCYQSRVPPLRSHHQSATADAQNRRDHEGCSKLQLSAP